MPIPTCSTCLFWQLRTEIGRMADGRRPGSCRRYAPRSFEHAESGKPVTRWPLTGEDDFCGDHARANGIEP